MRPLLTISRSRPSQLAAVALAVALLAMLLSPSPSAALAETALEAQAIDAVNRERAAAGLPEVTLANDLMAVARGHSEDMATEVSLHHNPTLGADVARWRRVGENVGRSPSIDSVHTAFMDSPSHRANILEPEWTEVGIGVEARDGALWVTQVFRVPTTGLGWPL